MEQINVNELFNNLLISMVLNFVLAVALLSPNACKWIHHNHFNWKPKNNKDNVEDL